MSNIYTLELIADMLRSIILIYFFHKVMPSRKYNKVLIPIVFILYTLISTRKLFSIILKMDERQIFTFMIICSTLVLIYAFIFKVGRVSEKFFLSSFYMSVALISSFATNIVLSKLYNMTLLDILISDDYKRIIAIFISRAFQFLIVYISLKNIDFIKYIKDKTLYIFGGMLYLNHMLIVIIQRYVFINTEHVNIYIIISVLNLLIIQILSIYILNMFSKDMNNEFLLKLSLDRKIHDKEIVNMYKEMSGWRHDFNNHLNMIWGLLETGSKEDVKEYLKEIGTSINKLDKNIYTDNIAINSVLISKMKIIKDNDINVDLDIKINSQINMSSVDICIILGNLLDNSIEACNLIDGYKFIDLKITTKDNNLIIKISNNTNGNVNKVNGRFITTKNRNMNGIGLIQIDNIVKEYNGYINRKHENNMFTTYLMIPYEE